MTLSLTACCNIYLLLGIQRPRVKHPSCTKPHAFALQFHAFASSDSAHVLRFHVVIRTHPPDFGCFQAF
jgi:hypothetical protein